MRSSLFLTLLLCSIAGLHSFSQSVAINTDGSTANSSAMLDIKSTIKGLLIPRMTTVQRTAIGSPATGLQVYDTDLNLLYFYNGSAWVALSAGTNYWTLSGGNIYNNTGTYVGIGTASPGDKLEINGNLRFSGIDTIYASPSTTGSGKSIWMIAGSPYVPIGGSGGNINIQATNNMPSGGSGYGGLGPSGTINLTGGSGYNTAGGNVNITGGQSSYWALANDSHSDVIAKGGFNINSTDAATMTAEGGHVISFNSTTSNGGNLLLKPGAGVNGGTNGSIQLDGVITYGISTGITGGSSGSPVSLLNYKSYLSLSPADATNNNYLLPSPATYPGRMYIIRDNSSSFNAVITTASGGFYLGTASALFGIFTLSASASPKTVMAISDGTNWIMMKQD